MRAILTALAVTICFSASPARADVDKSAIDAAIDRGAAALKRMQGENGSWPHSESGATSLAALTLIECGTPKTDKIITSAAAFVREDSYAQTKTYSLSLAVMFLESLEDPKDTPLVESMIVRLLAGQKKVGSWDYACPPINGDEQKRLREEAGGRVLKAGGRDFSKMTAKGERSTSDLSPEIRAQLEQVAKAGGYGGGTYEQGDNSNTQFAVLALWIGKRYGLPTQPALLAASRYFRSTQYITDPLRGIGCWLYRAAPAGSPTHLGAGGPPPAMTCSGLLSLATAHGATYEAKKARDEKAEKQDISKDATIMAGLRGLSQNVGAPLGWNGSGPAPAVIRKLSAGDYYFLWSLERICVIFGLERLDKKDWYNWGAEMLLASQNTEGIWRGDYSVEGSAYFGADSCFAMLFLKKVNLARDLSGGLRGMKDSGVRTMKAGGIGGISVPTTPPPSETKPGSGSEMAKGGSDTKPKGDPRLTPPSRDPKSGETTKPLSPEQAAARKLLDDAVAARGESQRAMIDKMRETRGVAYTEALVEAIRKMDVDGRKEARAALATRFTRLKDMTITNYFADEEPEIRRAAALAGAARGYKGHVPGLIKLLDDPEGIVRRAAHEALKSLTSKDFGPAKDASDEDRKKAIAEWTKWQRENSRE